MRFPAARRSSPPVRRTAARLSLEPLEDRLALAVTVEVNDGNLYVTGDAANDTVVIEERGAENAEKWVYVGGKLYGGSPFTAANGGVNVDLGGGNDSLTIRSGNKGKDGYLNAEIFYTIDLGEGNNSFTFQTAGVVSSFLYIESIRTGAGKDSASFSFGNVADSYVGLDGNEGIDLGAGDDRFSLTWKNLLDSTLAFTAGEGPVGVVTGEGNDSVVVSRGNNVNSFVRFGTDLAGYGENADAGFTNTVVIGGKSTVSAGGGGFYRVYGAEGVDKVSYDDERITGVESSVGFYADLGGADDAATVKLDGLRKRDTGVGNEAGDVSYFDIQVNLGDGDDVFKQTLSSSYWRLQNGGEFTQHVDAGAGDDLVSITATSKSKTLNLDGLFDVTLEGGEGRDAITVSLPKTLRIGVGEFNVEAYGEYRDYEGQGGEVAADDRIKITVDFVAASRNAPGVEDGYSAFITVYGGPGADLIDVTMHNLSDDLWVLVTIVESDGGEEEGDVVAADLTGNYDEGPLDLGPPS